MSTSSYLKVISAEIIPSVKRTMAEASPSEENEFPEFKGVRVVKALGEGGYGSVYEVIYEGKSRALKVYKRGFPDVIEIDTLSRIRHPNVIHILKILNEKDFGIIMPLGDTNLFRYLLQEEPKSLDTKIDILYKIVNAVDFILDQNILPFDLHSRNVVMVGDEPLIIDTGLAKRVDCRGATVSHSRGFPMARDIVPRENVRGSTVYSEASIVWGLGILIYNVFSSGNISKYPKEIARKMGIVNQEGEYSEWADRHLSNSASIRNLFRTEGVEDEKLLNMITDLTTRIFVASVEERLTVKDILQHPLFSGQRQHPMGVAITSDFTLYPEMKEEVKSLVKAMVEDIKESRSVQAALIPSSAIFGAVYAYQRFISIYGKGSEYKIAVPLQLIYNLYGILVLDDFVPSFISDDGKGLTGIDSYTRDAVTVMDGIIHPITDYDRAFTKLAEVFPDILKLDISSCPKPPFREVAKAILGYLYYAPLGKILPRPLYYKVTSYHVDSTLEDVKSVPLESLTSPDVRYYRYGNTYSKMDEIVKGLFGSTLIDPEGRFEMYYYDDLSKVSEGIVDSLFNNTDVLLLEEAPAEVDGEITIINLW